MFEITNWEKKKLEDLTKRLDEFKERLELFDYVHDKEEFFWVMKSFRKFIAKIDDNNLCELFFHSKYYWKNKDFFREKNYYYMRAIESLEAISIMTKWLHWKNNFLNLIDREQIKDRYYRKEHDIKSINFSDAKTLILVWSWPMPETILYIYENTNIKKIIWIDNNYEAIYISGEMISNLWLENINLIYAEWSEFDYSEADIVYIPWFVHPKDKILDQIAKTCNGNIQILVDSAIFMNKMLYDTVPLDINPRLKIEEIDKVISPYYKQEMIKIVKYDF